MNPKMSLQIRTLAETDLYKKFAIAFVFMSLVPIVLLVFIIYYLRITPFLEEKLPYFRLTILLVILLSLASFDLIRRSMAALRRIDAYAKEIASGNYSKRVEIHEKDDLGRLAKSFNTITAELEKKVKDLETSKKLLHNILEKVGSAVVSTRGIENLLELIIETMVQGTDATSGAIFLTGEDSSDMVMKVSFNLDKELRDTRIPTNEGLIGRVASLRKIESVSNVNTNAAAHYEFKKHLAKETIMATPLLYKNKLLGAIIISDKQDDNVFSSDDMILLNNVAVQTAVAIENFQLNEDAEKTYLETITALAVAVEAKDTYSRGHLDRVADYVERLGKQMNLDREIMKTLRNGAILHDLGKIGIRDDILKKMELLQARRGTRCISMLL
ncbi:MAG: GAF domain-containing protein [Candidatus Omnitrophica bacterium]|nr:GAF domain-containing protein [Candidatus Omnitrophota bacterium]